MGKQESNSTFNRRNFLKTAGVAAASAGVAPKLVFAEDEFSDNILVFVFQRGGIDGLSFLAPMNGHADRGHYEALRSNGTMNPSSNLQALSNGWGLHPSAAAPQYQPLGVVNGSLMAPNFNDPEIIFRSGLE